MEKQFIKNILFLIIVIFLLCIILYFITKQSTIDGQISVSSLDSTILGLFDKQYTRLLSTISILITIFGLVIPLCVYFFQHQNLNIERENILKDKIIIREEILKEVNDFKQQLSSLDKQQLEIEKQTLKTQGMIFFLSGNAVPLEIRKISPYQLIFWFFALDCFAKYPLYENNMIMIDSTMANIEMNDFESLVNFVELYTQNALKTLDSIYNNCEIKEYLRNGALEMSIKIRNLMRKKKGE